jgi:hypothetical protein
MTQFQSTIKNNRAKDINGHRTLFECNQFRIPKPPISTDNNQDFDEPSESSVIRKRPIQQDQTTTIAKK